MRMRSLLTLGTNPAWCMPTKLAQGNLRCKDQFHKLYVDNTHCHNGQYQVYPYIPAEAGEFDWLSHGRDYSKIFETQCCLHAPYQLDNKKLNHFFDSRLRCIDAKVSYLLFGIAKKARSVTEFQWPRWTLLWTCPLDIYKGWYSLCLFQLRLWSCHFRGWWGKKWIHDFWGPLLSHSI